MPSYTFYRKSTQEEWNEICSIAELEEKLAADPDLDTRPALVAIGDVVRQGLKKPSEGFRDILRNIKRRHRTKSGATDGINCF